MMHNFSEDNPLLGTWKLISITAIYPDGKINKEAFGENPLGYITYTAEGKMMVIFSKSDRPLLPGNAPSPLTDFIHSISVEERALAFTTFNAYAGSYEVDKNTVYHHVEIASIPNRVGKKLTRTFSRSGNQVTLRTPPSKSDNQSKIFELVWERLN